MFNEFPRFLRFVISYPEIFKYIGLTVLATISGQYFRNAMVANFGPLPMSIVGTIRKFTSVFLSVLLFGNSLSIREWTAAGIIFAALLIDTILGKTASTKVESEKKEKPPIEEPVKKNKDIEIAIPTVDPTKVETYI